MVVKIRNFGDVLMSRPAGREAFLLSRAYVFREKKPEEDIVLDFSGIKVMTPSWLDEFVQGIKSEYHCGLSYQHTENPTVTRTLNTIGDEEYEYGR
jgi:hypothetical protein